jgi:molecular chaperone DnaJ
VHPDRNPGSEERFKEVQGAYDVLSDPEKRKQYDRFGSTNGQQPAGGAGTTFDFGDFDLGDIFGGIFNRGGGRQQPQRGQRGNDVEVEVGVSFEDALQGVQTTVPVQLELACHTCHGTGAAPGTAPKQCPQCNGSGVVATSQGLFALQQPCPRCHGMGSIVETPCPTCRGAGRERRTKRYTVKIPAGVKDGTRIKLKGKGEAGFGGAAAGDLYVVTRVEPSKIYERRGDDLVVVVPVSFTTAALGGSVEAPTPGGPVSLKIPAGTEDGKLLRIKGRGAPRLKGAGQGDVLARVRIEVPKRISKKQRELLEQLQKVSG